MQHLLQDEYILQQVMEHINNGYTSGQVFDSGKWNDETNEYDDIYSHWWKFDHSGSIIID